MAALHNPTEQDLWCPALGLLVPAGGSVEITDKQAAEVNTISGVWQVTASRATAKRGGKVAEVSGPPPMETR